MRVITLVREKTGDSGTFGSVTLEDGTVFQTGELPWRDNDQNLSCILAGTYKCIVALSPHFGRNLYHVLNVPKRAGVLIHPANWMGDTTKNLKSDLLGCITLGLSTGKLSGQDAILSSKVAVQKFMDTLASQPFMLTIVEKYAAAPSTPVVS
jgi:hypothetical protein